MPVFPQSLNHEPHGTGVISHCFRCQAFVVEPGLPHIFQVLQLDLIAVSDLWKLDLNSVCHRLDPLDRSIFSRIRGTLLPFNVLRNVPDIH